MHKSSVMVGLQSWRSDLVGDQLRPVLMVIHQRSQSTETTFPTIWRRFLPAPITFRLGPEIVWVGEIQRLHPSTLFQRLRQLSAASVRPARPGRAVRSPFTSTEPISCPAAT